MSWSKKKKLALLMLFLGALLIFMSDISRIGFALSERLSTEPKISYLIAISLVIIGFIKTYLHFNEHEKLSANRAIRSYVSFSFGMGGIYYLIYTSHQGCFGLPPDISERASVIDFVYFSFITIATVGFGDIVPTHPFVRLLVLVQVVFGLRLILQVSKTKESV